jgi:hypothetical protein
MTWALGLDEVGDLGWPLRRLTGGLAVVEHVRARLLTERGTHPADEALGLPLERWITRTVTAGEVETEVGAQVREVEGVVRARVAARQVGAVMRVRVDLVVLDDTGAQVPVTLGTAYAPEGAPAWYVVAGPSGPIVGG